MQDTVYHTAYLRRAHGLHVDDALHLCHDVLRRVEVSTVLSLTARSDEISTHGYSGIKVLSHMKLCRCVCVCELKRYQIVMVYLW